MTDFIQYNEEGRNLLKAGVKLKVSDLVAYTKDGFIVPFGHAEGLVLAGTVGSYEGGDNTNGQDGDISVYVSNAQGDLSIFASDLTEEFSVKIENLNQPVYASSLKTLYTMPGTGRIPIGVLVSIMKNYNTDASRDPNEIVYGIFTGKIAPIFR